MLLNVRHVKPIEMYMG